MKFTFGIITNGSVPLYVKHIITSIRSECPFARHEIIVVGGKSCVGADTHLKFDETQKAKPWITRKKNLITQYAKYKNIVYLHDYLYLCPGWINGFKTFGDDFSVCMTRIVDCMNRRWRDWTLNPFMFQNKLNFRTLLPYNVDDLTKYMYISGSYWVAKKKVMEEFPLNEDLCWGDAEDIAWSNKVKTKYRFSMNLYSTVRLLKPKNRIFSEATDGLIESLRRTQYDSCFKSPVSVQ